MRGINGGLSPSSISAMPFGDTLNEGNATARPGLRSKGQRVQSAADVE